SWDGEMPDSPGPVFENSLSLLLTRVLLNVPSGLNWETDPCRAGGCAGPRLAVSRFPSGSNTASDGNWNCKAVFGCGKTLRNEPSLWNWSTLPWNEVAPRSTTYSWPSEPQSSPDG